MRYAIILMFSLSAFAQSDAKKPTGKSLADPELSYTTTAIINTPAATWSDKITKDGHYVATMDDPNNQFRCAVASYFDTDPRNTFGGDITSFTVVCTKAHEPEHETK